MLRRANIILSPSIMMHIGTYNCTIVSNRCGLSNQFHSPAVMHANIKNCVIVDNCLNEVGVGKDISNIGTAESSRWTYGDEPETKIDCQDGVYASTCGFVATADGMPYALAKTSILRDLGSSVAYWNNDSVDVFGSARIVGTIDIGAAEYYQQSGLYLLIR